MVIGQRVRDLDRGRVLVTGGPGSGKTTLLRERFARLVGGGADPERVALFTLSRRAAREARDRLIREIGRSLPDLPVFTVHGFAYRTVIEAGAQALEFDEEPQVLSAPEQYAAVRDMLGVELRDDWPRFGHLLSVRAFARQIADFVLRCQERLLRPDDLDELVEQSGRDDHAEVARFYRRYLDSRDAANQLDFAGLLLQAASLLSSRNGRGPFDHVLVDDYQDVTPAAEAIIAALAGSAQSTVVAADPGGHVFSYRGGSLEPLQRIEESISGIERVDLEGSRRLGPRVTALHALAAPEADAAAPGSAGIDARVFAHPGEEAEAVAHELLRLRVDHDVPWGDMAVVLRRYGQYLTALRHALTRHGVPFVVVAEQAALATEPVIRPVIDLLRYAFRPEQREQLLEALLVSPAAGLDPHDLRRLRREARIRDRSLLQLVSGDDAGKPVAGELGERMRGFAALVGDVEGRDHTEPLDALFFRLWSTLPHFRELVASEESNQRELDALSAFAATLGRFVERRPDASVEDYLTTLEAAEFGPDPWVAPEERRPEAVRIISAHRAQGLEFDSVIVAGCLEGEFPSLSHGSSLVSLNTLTMPRSPAERLRERLAEERALFRLAVSRARRGTLLFASRSTGSRTPRSPSRFAARLGCTWAASEEPSSRPATSLRGMEASLRGVVAAGDRPRSDRLAAALALSATDAHPTAWWGRREWTDPGGPLFEGEMKTSYSRLSVMENCSLQYLYSVELGLDPDETYQMWVGTMVHGIVDRVQRGEIPREHEEMCRVLDEEWRSDIFPNRAVEHRRYLDSRDMLWRWQHHEQTDGVRSEVRFRFPIDGALLRGRIDAIFRMSNGHLRIIDYKTGRSYPTKEEAKRDLQLATYYLAAKRTPELAELGEVGYLQLAYIAIERQREGFLRREISPRTIDGYEQWAETSIRELLTRIRSEEFAPNPEADCMFCSFKTICSRWPQGGEVALQEAVPR
ncbi:MAG: PD-(D/E)XK nuclease family protein [Actinomycetota bacterium]